MHDQRIKRQKEKSQLIDTIDGNPIFTEDDIEDTRITKLLQQRQNNNYDQDEQDIFLTDLLDADSDENDQEIDKTDTSSTVNKENDELEHKEMLENIFGSQSRKEAIIEGSQLDHDPLDIQTNATDLQYLMRQQRKKKQNKNLNQVINELDDQQLQNERVTLSEMVQNLDSSQVAMAKSVRKQINDFDENQELQRLKLTAQTKITYLNLNVN